MKNKQKKKKGASVQELLGVKTFSDYGIVTNRGELVFYLVTPTNLSVLSAVSIETKIRQLMYLLSAVPDIEIGCTDSSQCFDDNKAYLIGRMESESNPKVRKILRKDVLFLNEIQMEMATARQFMFTARFRNMNPQQVFERANTIGKLIAEQGFDCHRMSKQDIKRFLALYFDASMLGEQMPDIDGSQYFDIKKIRQEDENDG